MTTHINLRCFSHTKACSLAARLRGTPVHLRPFTSRPALVPSSPDNTRQRAHTTTASTSATAPAAMSSNGSNGKVDPRSKHFWESKDMPAQDGKVFIVTGSSSGMGFYCAEALAQRGAHVIVAARSLERCQAAAQKIRDGGARGKVEAMHLDLSSFRSIKAFADEFLKKDLPLHVLVNNAGVFLVPHDFTQEGFETTVGTNYFGPFLLTHLLLDKIKESAPSRVVNMASLFELIGVINWEDLEGHNARESGLFEYSASKIENIMFVRELNRRLKGTDVEAFASQPGLVQTELNGRKLDHRKLTAISVDIAAKIMGKDARSASLCLQRPAADPTVTGYGGAYFSPPWIGPLAINLDHAGMREPSNGLARNERAQKELYEQTLRIVNNKLVERGLPKIEAATPQKKGALQSA